MKILMFSAVAKAYGAEATALHQVNFSIEAGEFAALAGPSGSGKTTILNLAAGLDRPTGGRVFFLERGLGVVSAEALFHLRRRHVGFVFQAYNLFPVLNALE